MAKKGDQYAQMGYLLITESAANTLTFGGLSVFSNVLGSKGMILHGVDYFIPAATLTLIGATGDEINFGMAGSDGFAATPEFDDPDCYDKHVIRVREFGTAATMIKWEQPFMRDFSDLPGGGLLVPADRIYGWLEGGNLASASQVRIRFYYTILDLSAQEYLELAQALRVLR